MFWGDMFYVILVHYVVQQLSPASVGEVMGDVHTRVCVTYGIGDTLGCGLRNSSQWERREAAMTSLVGPAGKCERLCTGTFGQLPGREKWHSQCYMNKLLVDIHSNNLAISLNHS